MPDAAGTPTVLVTDAGRGSAITIIRSIGRLGWRVVAADADSASLGFRSRYASERLVYPSPEHDPRGYVEAMLSAARDFGVDLVVPVTDAAILPLSDARDRFEGLCRLAIPDVEALQIVTNKQKTLALAERLGVPVPRTCLVETVEEARRAAEAFDWPIVLKPQNSRLYDEQAGVEAFTVTYAEDMNRLVERMSGFEGRCPVLLQEYFRGEGHGVELLMASGRPLAAFQHRRLREVPVSGGASAFRESVALDPTLYDYAVRLLAALNWTGLAMVEFKVGPNGARLMEINGRVWGSLPLAVHSGMDFPARLARLYLRGEGDNGQVDTRYVVGRRSRNLELDMVWIATVLRGKQRYGFSNLPPRSAGIAALFGLLNPGYRFDILSLDDPRPGLAEIPRIIRKLRRKLREAA